MSPIGILSDDELPVCWSYNEQGERCQKPAGHPLEHERVVYTHWTDAEAWTPERMRYETTLRPAPPIPDAVAFTEENVAAILDGECLSCGHPSHDGECQVGVAGGKIACGCTSRI